MEDVVIVSGARTPIGSFGGVFKKVMATDLGVTAVTEAIKRAGLENDKGIIDDVIMGCCMMRSDEINIARCVSLKSGIPFTVPAMSIQRQCSSGMQAMVCGMQQIQTGESEIVLAGGVEGMTHVPYVLKDMRFGARMRDVVATDALTEGLTDPLGGFLMGITAENLAAKYNISRQEQDELAYTSQMRATKAIKEGRFKDEIIPVVIKDRKGEKIIDTDEHPKAETTLETLASLKPAFKKDGTVTAGNASGINDGAAAVILMSAKRAEKLGVKPLARIVSHAVAGVEPELMGYGPVPSTKKALERAGWKLEDADLIEVNEAFAAQYLACEKLLGLNREITNVNGSGIALGHPVGCTGCRIIISLINELKKRNKTKGIGTLCVGGGMGKTMCIEII
ncbi:MAG TPA: acetyl-CoA C-acetyltransferase [bacterium]|nr:acetyl-CoA C-acetyltransferase [bacterium]